MEPKFESKEYRDNLAKDLKEIRKDDPEEARSVLEEEKQTTEYKEAANIHTEEREKSLSNGGIEKKETPKQPIVEIAYRDNELFRTLVPKITDRLREINREVNIHSFPQGTPEEEIKKYFGDEKIMESFEGQELLSDQTCVHRIDRDLRVERMKDGVGLDDLAQKIMGRSLVGEKVYDSRSGEATYKDEIEGLKNILKAVIKENGEPEKLYIIEKFICSHLFNFGQIRNIARKEGEQMYKPDGEIWYPTRDKQNNDIPENEAKNKEIFNSHEFQSAINTALNNVLNDIGMPREEYDEWKLKDNQSNRDYSQRGDFDKSWADFIIIKLKDSLKEIVDEKKIMIVPDYEDVEKGDKNYVIVDRHAEPKNVEMNRVYLPLPLESTIYHIMEKKLLNVNFDNMEEAIKEEVDKVFKK